MAPPIHHVVQPFDRFTTKRLCDVPISLLPERWQELFSVSKAIELPPFQLNDGTQFCFELSKKPNAAGKRPLEPITPHQGQPRTTAGINQQDEAHPVKKIICLLLGIIL